MDEKIRPAYRIWRERPKCTKQAFINIVKKSRKIQEVNVGKVANDPRLQQPLNIKKKLRNLFCHTMNQEVICQFDKSHLNSTKVNVCPYYYWKNKAFKRGLLKLLKEVSDEWSLEEKTFCTIVESFGKIFGNVFQD